MTRADRRPASPEPRRRTVGRAARTPARALLPALALTMAACSVTPRMPPDLPTTAVLVPAGEWPGRREQLQARSLFALRGRVAVAAGDDGFSAGVSWQQQAGLADIRLDGPLGVGGLHVQAAASDLRLTTSCGERLDGAAARAELERRLGFELPIEALRYWVQGVPAPGGEAVEQVAPDAPRLARLEQAGWRIDYLDYGQFAAGPLPTRLSMTRSAARVRLVIQSWEGNTP
jgi:outer membrane lipoprotein LolB